MSLIDGISAAFSTPSFLIFRTVSQAELSRQTGIRPSTINDIYNEISERLNVEHLNRICEYLDCNINDLIEYIPNAQKKIGEFLIREEHGNRKK